MLAYPVSKWTTTLTANNKTSSTLNPSLIVPRLYLSNYATARSSDQLKSNGITHVVTIMDFDPEIPECIPASNKLLIELADYFSSDILTHLSTTTAFISAALAENKSNKVLVHCMMGISRSATVVCAYLIATTDMVPTEAIAFAQSKRHIVCPNLGFRQQLESYAEQFGKQEPSDAKTTIPQRIQRLLRGEPASIAKK